MVLSKDGLSDYGKYLPCVVYVTDAGHQHKLRTDAQRFNFKILDTCVGFQATTLCSTMPQHAHISSEEEMWNVIGTQGLWQFTYPKLGLCLEWD